jgi:hypothetical protein
MSRPMGRWWISVDAVVAVLGRETRDSGLSSSIYVERGG